MSAIDCDFNRSMQHLNSHYRDGGVVNEVSNQDLLHRQHVAQCYACAGLFKGFANRRLFQCFSQFHKASRHRPVSLAGFYRSFAQQNPAVIFGYAAYDQFRVLI